ncbi:MAG: M23 family metallopeptidase [Deltaproteobacteria bacterium]|nr:M23 family metallopeptidase [Deltaproteobacteria bacterium]
MRGLLVLGPMLAAAIACTHPPPQRYANQDPVVPEERLAPENPAELGQLDDRLVDFVFDGGQIEFEMYRNGDRVVQIARSRYAVPMMIAWSIAQLDNLEPTTPSSGVAYLPAAPSPLGIGKAVVLAELRQPDGSRPYRRHLTFRARFGDPRSVPRPYHYALPYPHGLTFAVLQGFHGNFSHKGSNEYAVDFDCPVATPVRATREGVIVAANAAAQGSGTTPDYLDYDRTNFVIVMHDDGTLGEYMHLAPSSVGVKPGQKVERGQVLALSGNTGFSSTPHLHFQVMTAGDDGISARSFPFELAIRPDKVEEPTLGRRYAAWE